ncbi:hypothetical protein [Streptomyces sp. NPDC006285]|uniref:hypothetical protein n=1 Tax=Streptomyces sp. NPDC006285 TaxID=3364742 RepID=UPI0036A83C62
MADVEESAVDRGHGGNAQGVALTAPYADAPVERGPLDSSNSAARRKPATLPGTSRTTGSSGAGAPGSAAVCSGRRSATAVRTALRLTP